MNMTSIQKHYDKLSTVERFAAINAAALRGDKTELAALRDSCPRKRWAIPNMRGMFEAFEFLGMWHMMTMLELDGLYWTLIAVGDDDDEIKLPGDNTWVTLTRSVIGRALSRQAAWVEVCAEHGADPWQWVEGLPGVDAVKMFLSALDRGANFGLIERAAVEVDPKPYVDDFRAVIAEHRRQWE